MTDKAQLKKFKALAREAECVEDESAFDKKLKRLVKSKPPESAKPKKKKASK